MDVLSEIPDSDLVSELPLSFSNFPVFNNNRNRALRLVGYFMRMSLNVLEKDYTWLAEATGLDRRTVNDYGLGKRIPPEDSFRKIAAALEASYQTVEDLVNDPDLAGV